MGERGNKKLRLLDRYLGIPLVLLLALYRKVFYSPKTLQSIKKQNPCIVLLCFGAIGDLLLSSALFSALRTIYPQATLILYCTKANKEASQLLENINKVHSYSPKQLLAIRQSIQTETPDIIIDTSQWARLGAIISAMFPKALTVGFSSARQYRHFAYDICVPHTKNRHEVDNFLALAQVFDTQIHAKASIQIPPCDIYTDSNALYLHMWPSGVQSYLKEWPAPFWAELANTLALQGFQVFFTGSKYDYTKNKKIFEKYGLQNKASIHNIAGKYSLVELAYLFQHAKSVISVNTGIMHLAALSNVCTIGIHGPTNPKRWGPLGEKSIALISKNVPSAYLHLGFEYPADAENTLDDIKVEEILETLKQAKILPNSAEDASTK